MENASHVPQLEGFLNCFDDLLPSLTQVQLDILQESTSQREETRRYLDDHHVLLKTRSLPTRGTRIFRDHVKDVMGRKWLQEEQLDNIKKLQDAYYTCKHGVTEDGVVFWVNLEETDPALTTERQDVRYARIKDEDIAVVRATDDCLRHFLKENGRKRKKIDSPEKRAKRIDLPAQAIEMQTPLVTNATLSSTHPPRKWFALEGVDAKLKERALARCQEWVNQSVHWAESSAKQRLVQKFEKDFDYYKSLIESNPLSHDGHSRHPQEVLYDEYRQEVHESLLVDMVNRIGNRMVEWYEQDAKNRMTNLTLSFQHTDRPGGPGSGGPGSPSEKGKGSNQGGEAGHCGYGGGGTRSGTANQDSSRSGAAGTSSGLSESVDSSCSSEETYSSCEENSENYESYEDSDTNWTSSTCDESSLSTGDTRRSISDGFEVSNVDSSSTEPTMIAKALEEKEDTDMPLVIESRNERSSDMEMLEAEDKEVNRTQSNGISTVSSFVSKGSTLRAKGDNLGALVAYRRAEAMLGSTLGRANPVRAKLCYEIGRVLHDQADFKGAQREYQKALECLESTSLHQREPKQISRPSLDPSLTPIGATCQSLRSVTSSLLALLFAARWRMPTTKVVV